MAVSKAQQKAVSKYVKEKYDRIEIKAPKGKKAAIQAHAEAHGESVNGFINRAIDQTMSRDDSKAGTAASAGGAVSVYSGDERTVLPTSDAESKGGESDEQP